MTRRAKPSRVVYVGVGAGGVGCYRVYGEVVRAGAHGGFLFGREQAYRLAQEADAAWADATCSGTTVAR